MLRGNHKKNKYNKNKNKNKSSKNRQTQAFGGKVIGSGGFGCVFDPVLKCQGSSKREPTKISKLMTERHAIKEYEEINSIKERLKDVDNHRNYYLLYDAKLCKPGSLTASDLSNFVGKCKALEKDGITKQNVNKNLDKLMLLNMPNGGIPVDDFIYSQGSISKLQEFNTRMIELLLYGIIPMNEKFVFHSDIKDSNVLVKEEGKLFTRLIDWGLSTEYEPFKDNEFPRSWRNRPLQFNVPFSVIIFSDSFIEKYTKYLKDGGKTDPDSLKPFVVDFIHSWIKERGAGHYKFINDIMFMLFVKDLTSISEGSKGQFVETNFTMNYITSYIVAILEKYTKFRKDGSLNLREYLDNVFIKIIDVYGFICVYYPLLELLFENYDKLTDNQMKILNLLQSIFIRYLYSERTEPIDIDELVGYLEDLGKLINNEFHGNASGIKKKNRNKTIKKQSISKLNFKRQRKFRTRRLKKYLMLS
jgi:serine/threonine protein kinase